MKFPKHKVQLLKLLLAGSLVGFGTNAKATSTLKATVSFKNTRIHKQAENFPVKGKVTDMNGEPLPGVTVLVKGTTIGVITDSKGNFSINVPDANATLVFSFIGYSSEEIKVESQKEINISMLPTLEALSEIVVVGYGEVKKSDLTGSVASVSLKELMVANPSSINQGLQGRIAGLMVSKNDGAPGSGITMQVRGVNSFSSSIEPLYVIDGIPFTAGSTPVSDANGDEEQSINTLAFLNPQDILSVEILKDASAAAIYGSRGSNGVVMITTKKGQTDKNQVEYTANYGIAELSKKIKMLNAADYATFQNEAAANETKYEGVPNGVPYPGRNFYDWDRKDSVYYPSPADFRNGYLGGGVNWQDEIFQKAAFSDHTLSFSGGNDKTNYYLSGNLVNQEGIIKNSGYDRYSVRANASTKVHSWLEVGTNNVFSKSIYDLLKTNSDYGGIVRSALVFKPTISVLDTETKSGLAESWVATNPYLYTQSTKNTVTSTYFSTASHAELSLLDALKFRQNLGYNYNQNQREVYYNRFTKEGASANGFGANANNSWASLVSESILSYSKTLADRHSLNAVGAMTLQNDQYQSISASAKNFPDDRLANNLGAGLEPQRPQSTKGESALVSYLGRVQYGYDGKYLATVSFRRDGSSKFAANNKWANFSSFALAWRASDEAFISRLNLFSNLKFRLSYGQTGNQAISSYQTISALFPANTPINGVAQSGFADLIWRGPSNPNLKWETTAQTNFGIDMGFFENRLRITTDLYHKKTYDLLQQVLIPLSSGFESMWTNYGTVTNKGLEITAEANILTKTQVTWDANANISFNRSKIGGLEADQFAATNFREYDPFFIQRNGQSIGAIYGYVEDGFYDNEAEVVTDPQYADKSEEVIRAMVGEIKYKDLDGKPGIGTGDRVILGDVNPDYIFGVTNNFQYKNFNLNFFLQGVTGNEIVNTNLIDITLGQDQNIPQYVWESRWTPETAATAQWPRPTTGDRRKMRLTSRMIEDGSYLRMKNINLGYTFKTPIKHVSSINVFGNVTNLFTITNYSWYDPDVNAYGGRGNGASRGVDMNSYPNSRTYSLGIRCVF